MLIFLVPHDVLIPRMPFACLAAFFPVPDRSHATNRRAPPPGGGGLEKEGLPTPSPPGPIPPPAQGRGRVPPFDRMDRARAQDKAEPVEPHAAKKGPARRLKMVRHNPNEKLNRTFDDLEVFLKSVTKHQVNALTHKVAGRHDRTALRPPPSPPSPPPQGCLRREGTSKAAPEAVGQAVGGGCQSGWGRLLSVANTIEAGT